MKRAFQGEARSALLRFRLIERGEITPFVLPPWAFDSKHGDCTTLVLLAPISTQFLLHVHPWQGLPNTFASAGGALQLTRCGKQRVSLLQSLVEMRSPRAVVHAFVAVGSATPPALVRTLPEREPGPTATPGDPGPLPERGPLAERVRRFADNAQSAGASATETAFLPSSGYVRLALEPGCHRLFSTGRDGAPSYSLLLAESDDDSQVERLAATPRGDVHHELCTARARKLLVSVDAPPQEAERQLSVAHFPLPNGLPGRFGPRVAELLVGALGKSAAPRRLGVLVSTTLGAQGRTPLPRTLLPRTCYLAAAIVLHGTSQGVSLGVNAGAANAEASSADPTRGPHLGFCTGRSGQVELELEARGLGLSWLFFLFQMAPARPEEP